VPRRTVVHAFHDAQLWRDPFSVVCRANENEGYGRHRRHFVLVSPQFRAVHHRHHEIDTIAPGTSSCHSASASRVRHVVNSIALSIKPRGRQIPSVRDFVRVLPFYSAIMLAAL
jgi:hypothetical protein